MTFLMDNSKDRSFPLLEEGSIVSFTPVDFDEAQRIAHEKGTISLIHNFRSLGCVNGLLDIDMPMGIAIRNLHLKKNGTILVHFEQNSLYFGLIKRIL